MSLRIAYWTHSAEAVKRLGELGKHVKEGLEPGLVPLVELRASQINGCAFCLDMHATQAREAGVSQQKLDCLAAWREVETFTPRERAALAWTEAVTLVADSHVPDEVYAEARAAFDEKELVALTFAIAVINAWNRMAVSMRSGPRARR